MVNHHWPNCIKQDLKGAEKCFAENGVEEERLHRCREISVQAIYSERLVMGQMVWLQSI